jgi:signal transduction histidine kinase
MITETQLLSTTLPTLNESSDHQSSGSMTSPARSPRILIVDDNPTNLKVLSDALRDQGWITWVATDGESAIEQVEYALPDLILLDVMMPGIDGFETCRQLKANPLTQRLPIIFMTALSDTVDKVKGLELGAVDYITKPFQHEEVLARVKLHLNLFYLNTCLEERVQERTQALEDSLNQLQNTQLQLIQSEKMSVLGQLVAGIGHEINNPIGCINGNIKHADDYIHDLLGLIELYQTIYPTPDGRIRDKIEEIDLNYLIDDLPNLIQSMQTSSDRIQEISRSLRNFARTDNDMKSDVQIHEGLESTLMILKHRLKANEIRPEIQIEKYLNKLPIIQAYAGPLNQVFMNIVANAIDAIDEYYENPDRDPNRIGQICISTSTNMTKKEVSFTIEDNGTGVPEEIRERIFEQSFTTKPIGRGTGLGLAISQQIIVDKHHGRITCTSVAGEGTAFQIFLPI